MNHLIKLLTLSMIFVGCRARDTSNLKKGGKDGNSGDVVACQWNDPAARKLWVLDYYETLNDPQPNSPFVPLRPEELVTVHPTNYQNVAQALINRLKNVDPYRVGLYTDFIASFMNDSYIGLDLRMPDLPDRGPSLVAIPKGCEVEITAYQQSPQKITNQKISPQMRQLIEKRYIIEKKYWDALDDFNKGVLIAHEVFYREARAYGFRQSKLIRVFSGFLLRYSYPGVNQRDEFAQTLIDDYGLPAITPAKELGLAYETLSIESYPNGQTSSAIIAKIPDLKLIEAANDSATVQNDWSTSIQVGGTSFEVIAGIKIQFSDDRGISAIDDVRTFEDYEKNISASEAIFGPFKSLGIKPLGNKSELGSCQFSLSPDLNRRIKMIEFTRSGLMKSISFEGDLRPDDLELCKDAPDVSTKYDLPNKTFKMWLK